MASSSAVHDSSSDQQRRCRLWLLHRDRRAASCWRCAVRPGLGQQGPTRLLFAGNSTHLWAKWGHRSLATRDPLGGGCRYSVARDCALSASESSLGCLCRLRSRTLRDPRRRLLHGVHPPSGDCSHVGVCRVHLLPSPGRCRNLRRVDYLLQVGPSPDGNRHCNDCSVRAQATH